MKIRIYLFIAVLIYLPLLSFGIHAAPETKELPFVPNNPMQDNPMQGQPQPFEDFFLDQLAGMTAEELDELAKLGEKIAEDMQSRGIDVDKYIEEQIKEFDRAQQIPPVPPAPDKKPEEARPINKPQPSTETKAPAIEKPIVIPVDEEKQNAAFRALAIIIQKTPDVMRQVFESRTVKESFKDLIPSLQDLGYYAYLLRQPKLLKYVATDQFARLYTAIKTISATLEEQESRIFVPDPAQTSPYTLLGVSKTADDQTVEHAYSRLIRKHNPERVLLDLEEQHLDKDEKEALMHKAEERFKQIEQAYYDIGRIEKSRHAFATIERVFRSYLQDLIDGARSLLKTYEPEAFALKQEQERITQEALERAKEAGNKEAPYAPTVFEFAFPSGFAGNRDIYGTAPSYTPPSSSYYPSYGGGSTPGVGGGSGKPGGTTAPGSGKDAAKGDGKLSDDKGKDDKNKPSTPQEKEMEKKEAEEKKRKASEDTMAASIALKTSLRKDAIEKMGDYFDELYDGINKRSTLLDNFISYLQDSTLDIKKAHQVNALLRYVIDNLNAVISDTNSLPKNRQGDFKQAVKDSFDKIDKNYLKKYTSDIVGLTINFKPKLEIVTAAGTKIQNDISDAKKYIHFGIDTFPAASPVTDPSNIAIFNANPTGQRIIPNLIDTYKKVSDLLRKQ